MRYLKKDLIQWLRDNQGELIADAADKAWRDDDSYKTLADALESGFNWTKTPGVSLAYWRRLHAHLMVKARQITEAQTFSRLSRQGQTGEINVYHVGDALAGKGETFAQQLKQMRAELEKMETARRDALAAENARLTEALAVAQDAKIDADGLAERYKSRYKWVVKQRDYALAEVARLQGLAAAPPTMLERTRDKIAELCGADVAQAFYEAAMAQIPERIAGAQNSEGFVECLCRAFTWSETEVPDMYTAPGYYAFWERLKYELEDAEA